MSTSRTEALVELGRTRPLTLAERAELDLEVVADLDPLALVEATAAGEQRLTPHEAERLAARAFGAPVRRAPRRPIRWRALGLALAAGVTALVVVRWPWEADSQRTKGAAPRLTIALAAQRPGTQAARALSAPLALEPGEALRIVVTATAPVHLALLELEGRALHPLWSSGAAPLPAGQSVVGPDATAGLSLSHGRSELVLVSSERALPDVGAAASAEALAAACPDCAVERLDVEQR
jgi:hypothetical protein